MPEGEHPFEGERILNKNKNKNKHVGVARTVEVPRKNAEKSAVTQALALPLFVKGVEKDSTWEVAAAEEERAAEGRY